MKSNSIELSEIKSNRKELRKITNDFLSNARRLTQADYEDYTKSVRIFVTYIKNTPLIYNYILSCGECNWDLDKLFEDIRKSAGRKIFPVGETKEEEVREIFAILDYIAEHNIEIYYGVAMGYSNSTKFQDIIKAFNERVVMIFIGHIETYLYDIGIDMGLDERYEFDITVQKGQVNVAIDGASINATNTSGIDYNQLTDLIEEVKKASTNLTNEDNELVETSLQKIQEETCSQKPDNKIIKMAFTVLKGIESTAEFGAAVAALFQFIQGFGLL